MKTKPPEHLPEAAVPLARAARLLRVPLKWLRDEVEDERLPGLQAGRAILVHVPTIAKILADRAKQEGGAR